MLELLESLESDIRGTSTKKKEVKSGPPIKSNDAPIKLVQIPSKQSDAPKSIARDRQDTTQMKGLRDQMIEIQKMKNSAIVAERYEEAQSHKAQLDELEKQLSILEKEQTEGRTEIESKIDELTKLKAAAISGEDYQTANVYKKQIDELQKQLAEKRVKVNQTTLIRQPTTPRNDKLLSLAREGNLTDFKDMIVKGANVNSVDGTGQTSLVIY